MTIPLRIGFVEKNREGFLLPHLLLSFLLDDFSAFIVSATAANPMRWR
jgi:hypothetical protein